MIATCRRRVVSSSVTRGQFGVQGGHNNSAILIPESKRQSFGRVELKVPKSIGHNKEFIAAARGEIGHDEALSNFAYAGPMTATALLGNIATHFVGQKLKFDPEKKQFVGNDKANQMMTRKPRPGWYI